ncbi:MAG: hypothetical protein Unbinned465contig1000_39 [Prokaryotic dsDNA virus sp.]|nr:MAG: hypothetical protein Unbinned465contig1000_39 [Prokaryotic dsDNA virus sp.]|tara:strand:- start:7227 stop:7403 length:177 start_codon:yes stop_codon:yes gene_type:complete
MITAAEKLRQVLIQVVSRYALEFDIDRFTITGVLEDVKQDTIWANLPDEEDVEEEEEE